MAISALRKSAKIHHKQELFTIVCAWCDRVQHGREWHVAGPINGPSVSHGICPDCYRNQIERLSSRR